VAVAFRFIIAQHSVQQPGRKKEREQSIVTAQVIESMGAPGGVEPPTNGLGNRCSIQLSYGAATRPHYLTLVYRGEYGTKRPVFARFGTPFETLLGNMTVKKSLFPWSILPADSALFQ
jgi:hypothetical protein